MEVVTFTVKVNFLNCYKISVGFSMDFCAFLLTKIGRRPQVPVYIYNVRAGAKTAI